MNEENNNQVNGNINTVGVNNEANIEVSSQSNVYSQETKKKKNSGVLVVILILLVAALGGLIVYRNFIAVVNPFRVVIDNSFNYLEANMKDSNTVSGNFSLSVKGYSNDSSASEILEMLSKINISASYGIDYDNKLMNIDFKSNYDNDTLLNANVYGEDGSMHVYLDDLYNKYVQVEVDEYDTIFDGVNDKEDYKTIITSVHSAVSNALIDDYFTTAKDTINNKKVNKTTLVLNKEKYTAIRNSVLNSLSNDSKFLESCSKISGTDASEIKDQIKILLDQEVEEFTEVTLNIYMSGNNFVRFEAIDDNNSITIDKNGDTYNYDIKSSDVCYSGVITIKKNGDDATILFSLDDGNGNNIEVNLTSSIKYNSAIEKKDVSNSVSYDKISNDDLMDIYSKLMENNGIMSLYEDYSSMTSSIYNNSFDDYDYDFDDYDFDY